MLLYFRKFSLQISVRILTWHLKQSRVSIFWPLECYVGWCKKTFTAIFHTLFWRFFDRCQNSIFVHSSRWSFDHICFMVIDFDIQGVLRVSLVSNLESLSSASLVEGHNVQEVWFSYLYSERLARALQRNIICSYHDYCIGRLRIVSRSVL